MRIALGIEYDGSGYYGWQRQVEGRTVQGCLEHSLSLVANHDVKIVCAGRTDTGVHATGQVVHFDTRSVRAEDNWLRGGNANLPPDIILQWVTRIDESFHARYSAIRRHYRYVILNRPVASAVLRHQVCHEYRPLDHERMQLAAHALVGEHDFTSFRAAGCQAKSPRREVYRLDVARSGDCIYIDVEANAFLHHMVRCIAGVLLAIGRGEQAVGWVEEILAARDRALSGVNAPPGGLYLVAVNYGDDFPLPSASRLPSYG